jgi:ELWxxDGT repeat protein
MAGRCSPPLTCPPLTPHGYELWVTDGSANGTSLVKDINPASTSASSFPYNITALGNGRALFTADDGTTYGRELWVTDGTLAGTSLVKDINSGSGSSSPQEITALGDGRVLFQADDGTSGKELWVTDGTANGTYRVDDINPGAGSSVPYSFAVLTPVCFCRGTLIRTDRGEVAVEALAVDDRVETASGALKPIRWIGFGRDLVTRRGRRCFPPTTSRTAVSFG